MTSVLQRAAVAGNAANAHSEVRSSARHEETKAAEMQIFAGTQYRSILLRMPPLPVNEIRLRGLFWAFSDVNLKWNRDGIYSAAFGNYPEGGFFDVPAGLGI